MSRYNLQRLFDAQRAIEELMGRHGGFAPYTKAQFAIVMDWKTKTGEPDLRRVQEVCNLTRDQDTDPELAEAFAGYVIGYSSNAGGMLLTDPTGEIPQDFLYSMLRGDMQRQQQSRTQNRRRIPTWKQAGSQAANQDDHDMARILWQGEHEIATTGFVSTTTITTFMQALAARGFET